MFGNLESRGGADARERTEDEDRVSSLRPRNRKRASSLNLDTALVLIKNGDYIYKYHKIK